MIEVSEKNDVVNEESIKLVKQSLNDLDGVNNLLEKTIKEIKNNTKITHFNSDFFLTQKLNFVSNMEKTLSKYLIIFQQENKLDKFILAEFEWEIKRLKNNYFLLDTFQSEEYPIKY